MNAKKKIPGRGAVNIPDVKFTATSKGIFSNLSNESFLWTSKWTTADFKNFNDVIAIYSMELNVSGEICCVAQEEEALAGLSDWQLQQNAKAKNCEDTFYWNSSHFHSKLIFWRK